MSHLPLRVEPTPSDIAETRPLASPFYELLNERLPRAAIMLMLAGSFAAAALAGLMHHLADDPDAVDRYVPLGLAATYGLLLLWQWWRPAQLPQALWVGLAVTIVGIALPTAWHLWSALQPGRPPLIETLPPLPPTLIPLTLTLTVFLRPRIALLAAGAAWLLIGAPVLVYLLLHPDELLSPRGQEIAIVLGPVMWLALAFIPFHRAMQKRLTALQEERARMQRLAERDALTGLFNRRAAEARLQQWHDEAGGVDLILFDIDRFKAINDSHGHGNGDRVLQEVAARCAALLRREDFLARWGGEEFLVVVASQGEQVAQGLRRAIADGAVLPVGRVTASFGVTRLRRGEDLLTGLQRADEALYAAKANGRDRVETR